MLPLSFSEYYVKQSNNLILDIVCRYLYMNKLGKLDAFTNLIEQQDFNELATLLKKLRIIADDVNFSFTEKQKIDELSEEEERKAKLPLPTGIGLNYLMTLDFNYSQW